MVTCSDDFFVLAQLAAASFLPRCVKSSMAGENAMGMPNTFLQG